MIDASTMLSRGRLGSSGGECRVVFQGKAPPAVRLVVVVDVGQEVELIHHLIAITKARNGGVGASVVHVWVWGVAGWVGGSS